jgi:hypothetical protein
VRVSIANQFLNDAASAALHDETLAVGEPVARNWTPALEPRNRHDHLRSVLRSSLETNLQPTIGRTVAGYWL